MEEEKEIKIIENPLQANGIEKLELEMGNDEAQELTRCRKCRILCGYYDKFTISSSPNPKQSVETSICHW